MKPYTNGHARPHLVDAPRLQPALLPVAPSTSKASPATQRPRITSPAAEDGPRRGFTRVVRRVVSLALFLAAFLLSGVALIAIAESSKSGPILLVWLVVLTGFVTGCGVVVSWEWQR